MKCVIPAINIKSFGKAIQSLARIGEEISIEPTDEGLHLKAVNSTRSCMAFYEFKPRFFQHYDDGSPRPVDQNSTPRFRLTSKCCLNVFRSLNNMDKLVEHCNISLNEAQCRVVFSMHCKHGITKNYNLTYMEAEPLRCTLSKSSCPNIMKADSKLYIDIIGNFQSGLEELTFIAKKETMCVRNFVDADSTADPLKTYNTTMTLAKDEFESYSVTTETSISFCLKEVKAALLFGEFAGTTSTFYFDEAGKPMFIVMDSDPTFEVTFIVSTISESLSQSSTASEAAANTSTAHNNTSVSQNHSTPAASAPTSRAAASIAHHTKPQGNKAYLGKLGAPTPRNTLFKKPRTAEASSSFSNGSHTASTLIHNNTSEVDVKPKTHSLMNDTSISLLPTNKTINDQPSMSGEPDFDDVDALLKHIDETSKLNVTSAKKAKSIFFGKKPAEQKKTVTPTQKYLDEVLAEDSDED